MTTFLAPLLRNPGDHDRTHWRRVGHAGLSAFDSASRRTGCCHTCRFRRAAAPGNAVHTFFMRFSIDVTFASKDGRCVKLSARPGGWRRHSASRQRSNCPWERSRGPRRSPDCRPTCSFITGSCPRAAHRCSGRADRTRLTALRAVGRPLAATRWGYETASSLPATGHTFRRWTSRPLKHHDGLDVRRVGEEVEGVGPLERET